MISRREFLKGAAGFGVLVGSGSLAGCGVAEVGAPPQRPKGMDAIQHHTLYDLRNFTEWLEKYDRRGFIGEVNWPNGLGRDFPDEQRKWNLLGEQWYQNANAANLWVTAFCADERQVYGGFWLSIYRSAGERHYGEYLRAMSATCEQAPIVEAHPGTPDYCRGVNVAAAAAWSLPEETDKEPPNSNLHPGVYGEDYWYPGLSQDPRTRQNTYQYLAKRGIDTVRLPFRWERLQTELGGPLNDLNLSKLKESVAAAGEAGIEVILSLQNYGGYWADEGGAVRKFKLGTPDLPVSYFQDVWTKLSDNFRENPAVLGYDLMNEPANAGGIGSGESGSEEREWEALSRAAVHAIRGRGDRTWLMVPGYGGMEGWSEAHPEPWVSDDPYERHLYTVHQYFDSYRGPGTGGGKYRASYAIENRRFAQEGW